MTNFLLVVVLLCLFYLAGGVRKIYSELKNLSGKLDLMRERERKEKKIKFLMPHLFNDASSDEVYREIDEFIEEIEAWNSLSIEDNQPAPWECTLENMKSIAKDENNVEEKKKMQKFIRVAEENKKKLIKEITENHECTQSELYFLLKRYYENVLKSFPTETVFAFSINLDLLASALPEKKK